VPFKDPEDRRKHNLRYRAIHRERLAAYDRERHQVRKVDPAFIAKRSEYHAAWYLRNKARISGAQKLWAGANRDKTRRATQRWREANPGAEKFRKSEYLQTARGKELSRIYHHNRQARLSENGGTFSREQWLSRFEFYGRRCAYCEGELSSDTVQIEHVIPLSRGGPNWASNLVPACSFCNLSKGNNLILPLRLCR